MTDAAIQLRDLSYSYDDIPVLTDVCLDIFPGDTASIIGPNGGGKTTLIKLILGLESPDKGTVLVYGNKPEHERTRIGYVPQYARYDPHFPISLLNVVCMGRIGSSLSGRYTRHDKEIALEALTAVNLADLAKRPFSALSGGQRQRVLIARALATESDILILDEPTASLDRQSEQQLFALLAKLNKNMIILMVTHEIGVSSTFFQRVICVNNQVFVHPTSELTGELLRDMYGGDLRMIRHDHRCGPGGHEHD
ncbi:MAG: ABC transporter ATP-binding protein [Candidatus Electrothrix sp. GW3-4]|uniref:metal ABC transporter ATP-binding protein n=1 Tax=Candidatus Electrothrix sp. GW3-4 TaxID=3126740 RepID=UPI0030CED6F8